MSVAVRYIVGALAGAVVGGILGYVGKCSGGGCPLTCNPFVSIIVGTLMGLMFASAA